MSKLTPEQIQKIHEAKARREAQREEARKRREAEAEQRKHAEEFIAKEFGETSAPPAPEPNVAATIIPDADIQKATDTNTLFREWLRTPEGLDASDPRLPNDTVRRVTFLEDALGKAFAAGYKAATS